MKTLLLITQDESGVISARSDLFQITTISPDFFSVLKANLPQNLHPELAERLRVWRRDKSRALGLSAYIILTNKVLLAISNISPISQDELLSISGFGPSLMEHYGDEILNMVAEYKSTHSEEYEKEEEQWDSNVY